MKPSVWFWIVGVFALLWNGFGAVDLTLTLSNNEDYLAGYTPEQIAYWQGLPWWRMALWVVGVATALAASVLFLMRRAAAVPLFLVSPVAMVIGLVHDLTAGAFSIYGAAGFAMSGLILLIAIGFVWYAARQRRKGVLRAGAKNGEPVPAV